MIVRTATDSTKTRCLLLIFLIHVKLKVLLWWLFMTVGTFKVKGALFVTLICPSDLGLPIYQPGSLFTTPASHLICLSVSVSLSLILRTLTQALLCAAACLDISFFHSY